MSSHSEVIGEIAGTVKPRRLSVGPVTMDHSTRRAYSSDAEVRLSPLEYQLLEVLLERRGESLSRRDLLKYVWDTEAEIETRTVDMHVARLRSKLGPSSYMVETVRGKGYRFRIDPSQRGPTSQLSDRAGRPASTYRALDRRDRRIS
jgi:DNA-binding response OmpR family regulator